MARKLRTQRDNGITSMAQCKTGFSSSLVVEKLLQFCILP